MTVGLAASAANAMLDTHFDTTPTIKIHTGDPGAPGTTAVSVGEATTKVPTYGAGAAGSKSMTNAPVWTNGGSVETITHLSVYSAATFKASAALTAPQPWVATNTFTLTSLVYSIAPLAA